MSATTARGSLWQPEDEYAAAALEFTKPEKNPFNVAVFGSQGKQSAQSEPQGSSPALNMEEMLMDSLSLDGVSCGACHQQRPEFAGLNFSAEHRCMRNIAIQ